MTEYAERRAQALSLDRQMQKLNCCVPGRGTCCVRDAIITGDDATHITKAIESGKIPDKIKQIALRNAQDTTRKACPFLGKTNKCLIYEHRPIRCIIWGNGGIPNVMSVLAERAAHHATGVSLGLAATEITHRSCPECVKSIPHDRRYPTQELLELNDIAVYTDQHSEKTTLGEFVQDELKDK